MGGSVSRMRRLYNEDKDKREDLYCQGYVMRMCVEDEDWENVYLGGGGCVARMRRRILYLEEMRI